LGGISFHDGITLLWGQKSLLYRQGKGAWQVATIKKSSSETLSITSATVRGKTALLLSKNKLYRADDLTKNEAIRQVLIGPDNNDLKPIPEVKALCTLGASFVALGTDLLISEDGRRWRYLAREFFPFSSSITPQLACQGRFLLMGYGETLLVSTDRGRTWSALPLIPDNLSLRSLGLGTTGAVPRALLVYSAYSKSALYLSP